MTFWPVCPRANTLLIGLALLGLVACASPPVAEIELPEPVDVELSVAHQVIAQPLNVSILLFETSVTDAPIGRIYEPIRNAEAAYLPVLLRNTLNESGHWGSVSVVPTLDTASELFVTGQIVQSDAVELAVRFRVVDSRGVVWLDEEYRDYASEESYLEVQSEIEDPFKDMFNHLANDMSTYLLTLDQKAHAALLDTAMLRYAMLLSPEAFSNYLVPDEQGHIRLNGLPAANDPLYRYVREIRGREFEIQDVVDDHFENFHTDMRRVYPYWRQSSFELLSYNNQLATGASAGGRGSWQDVERVYRLYRERKLNEDELRELAMSFEREIDPTVAELEGRVIELQGSLVTQYQNWREILRQIYQEVTANTPDLSVPDPVRQ